MPTWTSRNLFLGTFALESLYLVIVFSLWVIHVIAKILFKLWNLITRIHSLSLTLLVTCGVRLLHSFKTTISSPSKDHSKTPINFVRST